MTSDVLITGERIKAFRIKNGLTQLQIAHFMGVRPLTVGRWESGETIPSDRHISRLQRLLSSDKLSPEMFEPSPGFQSNIEFNFPVKLSIPSLDEETEQHLRDLSTILKYPYAPLALKSRIIESLVGLALNEIPEIIKFDRTPWGQLIEKAFSELPPRPKSPNEKAGRDQSQVTITVDSALLGRLLEEAEDRGFTPSGLLEVILWNYLGKPKLSFEKDASSAEGKTKSQDLEKDSGDDPAGSDHKTDM
jgi:transcriptional regulator with XRE-family HTH domain